MSERESQSLLGIDLEIVDTLLVQPRSEIFTPNYLQENLRHMREFQPGLAQMIEAQSMGDFHEIHYFRAGSFSTYDLICSADQEYWESHQLSDQALYTTKKNFCDSAIKDEAGEQKLIGIGWLLNWSGSTTS